MPNPPRSRYEFIQEIPSSFWRLKIPSWGKFLTFPITEKDISAYAEFARKLATAASKVILPLFRTQMDMEDKAPNAMFDPVTKADRDAEQVMRDLISDQYPDHGIEGEEFGLTRPDSRLRWILDPIDGTKSFVSGVVSWGVLIGLLVDDKPVLGVLHQPFLDETYLGYNKSGLLVSHQGTRSLKVRRCTDIGKAVLMTTSPRLFGTDEKYGQFKLVENKTRMTRYGGDCYNYGLLASGHIDLVIEAGLQRYDIAPLIPIIEAAGGIVTDWTGGNPIETGTVIAAGDARIHAATVELLAS